MKKKKIKKKRMKRLKLRTRHMPTKVFEKDDKKRYRRKVKHKKKVDNEEINKNEIGA